jgi:hypothetical protein
MAVLNPTILNPRVRIQGYNSKEGRNYYSPDHLVKNQVVTNTREFNTYWEEYKKHEPPLAFAFIFYAWNHIIEHKVNGSLFSPLDSLNFLSDPVHFLNTIGYPWNTNRKGDYNPFNRSKKWPE